MTGVIRTNRRKLACIISFGAGTLAGDIFKKLRVQLRNSFHIPCHQFMVVEYERNKSILTEKTEGMNILVTWLSYAASIENAALGAKSGGDTHIIEFSKKGNSLGHKVVLLTSNSGKFLLHAEGARLELHQISVPFEKFLLKRGGSLAVSILYILRALKALFVKFPRRFNAIVAPSHYPPDILSALFLRLRNPKSKIVVYFHGFFPEIPHQKLVLRIPGLLYNYLGFLMLSKIADLIFVFNRHTWNLLHPSFDCKKVVLTSNGVDVTSLNLVKDKKLFDACFLGRLAENKGIPDLVKVWKLVYRLRKDAKLAVVGSGPQEKLLNELATREGLESNIILFGLVPEGRKYEVLQSSKVFVFPSYLEGWGVAVAEAMACGLPVVAYNLLVYKEVFDNKLITVPLGDVEEMAKQVIYLLENPEFARKIGEANREFVKKYDWGIVAKRELKAINMIVHPSIRVKEANAHALNLDMSATK